jgi:hypothetical protein
MWQEVFVVQNKMLMVAKNVQRANVYWKKSQVVTEGVEKQARRGAGVGFDVVVPAHWLPCGCRIA